MNHLRHLAVAVAIVGVAALPVASAKAADPSGSPVTSQAPAQLGLGAGPSTLVLGAGETISTFTLYNAGNVEQTITVSAFDFVTDSSGKRVRSTEQGLFGAAAWMKMSPATMDLKPNAAQIVTVTLNIPAGASPGDHYAVAEANGTVTDAVWAQMHPAGSSGSGVVVRTHVAFPVTVIVRVPGEINPALRAELPVPSFVLCSSGSYEFGPAIINAGNVAAAWIPATGATDPVEALVPTLRLANSIGLTGGDSLVYVRNRDGTPGALTVLPGTTTKQQLTLSDVPLIASYDYTYKLPAIAADGRADITASGHFWIVNVQKVFLFIVLPLLVLILLLVLRVWRKRQDRRYRARLRVEAMQEARAALEREAAEARSVGPLGPYGGGSGSGTIR